MNISVSKIREFLTCQKRYEYKYVNGLVPKTYQRSLEFGSMGHKLLELYYLLMAKGAEQFDVDASLDFIRKDRGAEDFDHISLQKFETDLFAIAGMIQAYIKHYELDRIKYEVLLIEEMITLKDPINGQTFKGKPDLVLQNRETKDIWIVDHKFLTNITQGMIKKLPLDYQVHAYLKMFAQVKEEKGIEGNIRGVIYNMVRKPSKKLKQKQTLKEYQRELHEDYLIRPEEFFYRENVVVTPFHIRGFDTFMDQVTKEIKVRSDTGEYMQNIYACDNYGECPYMDLCLYGKEQVGHNFKNWFRNE